ncbi:hypothetical protein SAMN06298210_11323 [Prevotellaceae bacterium KH2P17]|nr:hypothetical protein SAMN06298210_11323 [Prevotellaceae bacterium KH2P17]
MPKYFVSACFLCEKYCYLALIHSNKKVGNDKQKHKKG